MNGIHSISPSFGLIAFLTSLAHHAQVLHRCYVHRVSLTTFLIHIFKILITPLKLNSLTIPLKLCKGIKLYEENPKSLLFLDFLRQHVQ